MVTSKALFAVGAVDQRRRFGLGIVVVIGKRQAGGQHGAEACKALEQLRRSADAGECNDSATAQLVAADRQHVGPQNGFAAGLELSPTGRLAVTDNDEGVCLVDLPGERQPQRTGRHHQAIAEAGDAVDHQQLQVLPQATGSGNRRP